MQRRQVVVINLWSDEHFYSEYLAFHPTDYEPIANHSGSSPPGYFRKVKPLA